MTGVISDVGTMAEVPQYTEAVVQSLVSEGLFYFESEARHQIDSFYRDQAGQFGDVIPPDIGEQGRALSYLHAAEYALLPAIINSDPSTVPPRQEVQVSESYTQLALMKGDCSLIIWTHAPRAERRINSLHISDLTVFGGDASKVRHITAPWPEDIVPDTSEVEMYVRELYSRYLSGWEPAADVARAGIIQLQGLLWCLKSAVVEFQTEAQFREYLGYIPQYVSALEQQPWTPEGPTISEQAGLSQSPSFTAQWQELIAMYDQGTLTAGEFADARSQLQSELATSMYQRGALTDAQLAATRARIQWDQESGG
jgi:hypothetical protein